MVIVDKWFTCMSVLWLITGLCIIFGNLDDWTKVSDGVCYTIVGILFGVLGIRYENR